MNLVAAVLAPGKTPTQATGKEEGSERRSLSPAR
jgi:hypothetical protein